MGDGMLGGLNETGLLSFPGIRALDDSLGINPVERVISRYL